MTLAMPERCNDGDVSSNKRKSITQKKGYAIYPSDVCGAPGNAVASGSDGQPFHEDNHPMLCCKHEHESHQMGAHQKYRRQASRRDEFILITISLVTLAFILAEVVGGYLAHSLAIMTDAFHMISDLASFLISILAIHLARRSPTARYPFGYQRAEVLGALCSIAIIWVLTAFLVYLAAMRIVERKYEVEVDLMMVRFVRTLGRGPSQYQIVPSKLLPLKITAGIAVFFNIVIGALLHFAGGAGHHHHHGHLHAVSSSNESIAEDGKGANSGGDDRDNSCSSISSSGSTSKTSGELEGVEAGMHTHANLNIRAAFIHVLGDLVQSLGVLLASVIIKFTDFQLADPICTFLFGILVLMTTVTVLRDALAVLMESAPPHVSTDAVVRDLISIPGVSDIHSLRIWALKLDSTAIAVHIDIEPTLLLNAGGEKAEQAVEIMGNIVGEAHRRLHSRHHIEFITVQVQCQPLARREKTKSEEENNDEKGRHTDNPCCVVDVGNFSSPAVPSNTAFFPNAPLTPTLISSRSQ